jgi:L-alanine-DL-glutamate epimerase-like enolase superfamily enzyme
MSGEAAGMKIHDASAFHIAIPYSSSGDRRHNRPTQDAVYIRLTLEDGTVGWGEAFGFASCEIAKFAFDTIVAPMVIGQAFADPESFVAGLWRRTQGMSRSGPIAHAISGVEIALWDLLGKTRKLPVYELLGGAKRRRLKAYASLLRIGETDLIRAECEKALNLGYRQVKIHERTVEAGEAARSVIGPDMPLMMDTNCTWSVTEAEDMIPKLRHLDLTWLEEPIYPPDDYLALKMLRGSGISIAAGENIGNVVHLRHAVALGALDIVQPSAAKMGGISALLEAARICRSGGVEFHPHSPIYGLGLMATLHVLASEEEDLSCEFFFTDLADCPIGPLHKPVDGHFEVPEGDGLGIEVDEDMLDHYAFARR